MPARSPRSGTGSLRGLLCLSLAGCQELPRSTPAANLFVPASIGCDTLHPVAGSSTRPNVATLPPKQPLGAYQAAGPISLGTPKRGDILWRVEHDLGDMLVAPDGEGGVFLFPYGRDFYGGPRAAARLDGTGEIVWYQPLRMRGFAQLAVLPSKQKGPLFVGSLVEQSAYGNLRASDVGYVDSAGNIQRVKLGPGVDVTQLDVGADGSVAFTCTTAAEAVVAGKTLTSVENDELFVGRIDPRRRLDWVVHGGSGTVVDVAASNNGDVQYLVRTPQDELTALTANREGSRHLATLPKCIGDHAVPALDGEGHAFVAEDECGTDEKTHDLTQYDLNENVPKRKWQVDFLEPGDMPLSIRVRLPQDIVVVSQRVIASVTPDGHANILARLADHETCWSGAPGIRSIVADGESVFTSAGCENSTPRESRIPTTMITRYAAR